MTDLERDLTALLTGSPPEGPERGVGPGTAAEPLPEPVPAAKPKRARETRGRKSLSGAGPRVKVAVAVDPDVWEKVGREREKSGKSASGIINEALRDRYENKKS